MQENLAVKSYNNASDVIMFHAKTVHVTVA